MAEINWKGIIWKAAYGSLSVKELLTILKGFGTMEILKFEKPGVFHGEMSLALNDDGTKEITLYHLEVAEQRKGLGRQALKCLKEIFRGDVYVEDPGLIKVRNANEESLPFWVRMYQEGLIDSLDSEVCRLTPGMKANEVETLRFGAMKSHDSAEPAR